MGLLSWFTGRIRRVGTRDKIWLTDAARLDGLLQDVRNLLPASPCVLVVTHFPQEFDEIAARFERQAIPFTMSDGAFTSEELPRVLAERPGAVLALAEDLQSSPMLWENENRFAGFSLLVAGRHFLAKHEQPIAEFAASLHSRGEVVYYQSLDDPLIRVFCGSWVQDTLRTLGMQENECLEHSVLSRQLLKAQRKIPVPPGEVRDVDSAAEWLARNMPDKAAELST